MGELNQLASEGFAVVGAIDPDVLTATTHDSGWIDAKDFHNFLAVIMVGTLGASATVDAILQQASDSSGTGAKAITGKAITQLTDAGSDDDSQALINLRPEELDRANGFTHFRVRITVAAASCDGAAAIFGCGPRYGPASDYDAASVDEIVS